MSGSMWCRAEDLKPLKVTAHQEDRSTELPFIVDFVECEYVSEKKLLTSALLGKSWGLWCIQISWEKKEETAPRHRGTTELLCKPGHRNCFMAASLWCNDNNPLTFGQDKQQHQSFLRKRLKNYDSCSPGEKRKSAAEFTEGGQQNFTKNFNTKIAICFLFSQTFTLTIMLNKLVFPTVICNRRPDHTSENTSTGRSSKRLICPLMWRLVAPFHVPQES